MESSLWKIFFTEGSVCKPLTQKKRCFNSLSRSLSECVCGVTNPKWIDRFWGSFFTWWLVTVWATATFHENFFSRLAINNKEYQAKQTLKHHFGGWYEQNLYSWIKTLLHYGTKSIRERNGSLYLSFPIISVPRNH